MRNGALRDGEDHFYAAWHRSSSDYRFRVDLARFACTDFSVVENWSQGEMTDVLFNYQTFTQSKVGGPYGPKFYIGYIFLHFYITL